MIQRGFNSLSVENRSKLYAMIDRPYSLTDTTRINHPLILITQIQRSGGSLFTRLFDHHHQVHTLPIELFCIKNKWLKAPELNTDGKFRLRHNRYMQSYLFKGFDKGKSKIEDSIPFDFNFGLQEEIISQTNIKSERDALNNFFTSFFNSWVNYQNMDGEKKYVLAFAPRTIRDIWKKNPEYSFYSAYPNGYILSIIRHPKNWYSSAEKHSHSYSAPDKAFKIYNSCLEASIKVKKKSPDQKILVKFEDLITNTGKVMQMVCNKVGIDYHSNLLQPTFNSTPTKSNSSFKRVLTIDKNVLNRTPKHQIDNIPSYKKALKLYKKAEQLFDSLDYFTAFFMSTMFLV